MTTTMTVRLDEHLKQRLEKLSQSTYRSKSFLAAEAIREFVELNEWQVAELTQSIKEADEGDFATDKEVSEVMNRWGADCAN